MDFCTSNLRGQGTRDLSKHISVFRRLFSACTSTALGAACQKQLVVQGGKTFEFERAGHSLGFGLEARKGALSVLRAAGKKAL